MIYTGQEAKKVCEAILSNEDYDTPIPGYDHLSSGYWKECGKWIAYDNTTGDCWMEEFDTLKEAKQYVFRT